MNWPHMAAKVYTVLCSIDPSIDRCSHCTFTLMAYTRSMLLWCCLRCRLFLAILLLTEVLVNAIFMAIQEPQMVNGISKVPFTHAAAAAALLMWHLWDWHLAISVPDGVHPSRRHWYLIISLSQSVTPPTFLLNGDVFLPSVASFLASLLPSVPTFLSS